MEKEENVGIILYFQNCPLNLANTIMLLRLKIYIWKGKNNNNIIMNTLLKKLEVQN